MSILPSNYPKEIRALDEALGKLVAKSFKMPFKHFYNPTQNPHLGLLAHSFGVDLDTKLPINQQQAQLEAPLLKKIYLGTERGLKEAVFKVFGEVQVVTFANKEVFERETQTKSGLQPFEYLVTIAPDSKSTVDMERAINAIKAIQPARDRFKSLKIDFPMSSLPLTLQGSFRLQCNFSAPASKYSTYEVLDLGFKGGGQIRPAFVGHNVYNASGRTNISITGGAHLFLTFRGDQRSKP
ncbi:phage tail protein [Helicobacter cynogastricus]|uniref:phage tail protein n=1 Tax=Helicobacter cynogastricus TaxID=329937 RepID=UPI000CF12E23|nr:phage tail protein [Helicobacter cynogastricus]